jgi:sugar lactone lactonase YvrE
MAPDGTITTVAGTGAAGFSGDEGAARAAHLNQSAGIAVDSQGTLFIVDSRNQRVRKVGLDGVITTMFGGGPEGESGAAPIPLRYYPSSVVVERAGNLLIADPFNQRIWKLPGVAAPGLLAGRPFP